LPESPVYKQGESLKKRALAWCCSVQKRPENKTGVKIRTAERKPIYRKTPEKTARKAIPSLPM
jgi:hypothetical protein